MVFATISDDGDSGSFSNPRPLTLGQVRHSNFKRGIERGPDALGSEDRFGSWPSFRRQAERRLERRQCGCAQVCAAQGEPKCSSPAGRLCGAPRGIPHCCCCVAKHHPCRPAVRLPLVDDIAVRPVEMNRVSTGRLASAARRPAPPSLRTAASTLGHEARAWHVSP
jgi:hypothetical protein